jgi:hypothetical protein
MTEESWLTITEAAEATGYHRDHLRKLAKTEWRKPEGERAMKVRRLSGGDYLVYFPSLQEYIEHHAKGPYKQDDNGTS